MLGIGSLLGDTVSRMTGSVERNGNDGLVEVGGEDGRLGSGRGGERDIKLALSGCHDTTLAALLTSLGAFPNEPWPPYTSHIAIELFRQKARPAVKSAVATQTSAAEAEKKPQSWWKGLFGSTKETIDGLVPSPQGIARRPIDSLTAEEKQKLDGYYVRLRYNDKIMTVPGCKVAGKHLDGNESFCTLVRLDVLAVPHIVPFPYLTTKQEAFKSIADKFTPPNWHSACATNLGANAFPEKDETAGY